LSTLTIESAQQSGAVEDSRVGLRGARWGLWGLDGVVVTMAAVFVMLAPLGNWKNRVMGVELWTNSDPTAGYAIASLFALSGENRTFVGHPGMPLSMILGASARVWHWVYEKTGGKEPFFEYWARHVRVLFVMAGLVAALLHVVSFHLLFAFARRLAGDARTALVAVVAYATAFPVLFYTVRLSPEPLLVIGFLGTILALWKAQERREEGSGARAWGWAAVAAAVSLGAVYSKVHLAALMPIFALAQLLMQRGTQARSLGAKLRERAGMLGCFVATAGLSAVVMGMKVDWGWFFRWWRIYVPGNVQIDMTGVYARDVGVVDGIWLAVKHSVGQWVPGLTPPGLFLMAEGVFIILAVWGLVWWWRKHPEKRRLMVWPILYVAMVTPIAVYRAGWHYLFLHLALGAVALAMLVVEWMKRWRGVGAGRWVVAALAAVVVMHGGSIFFYINGKLDDVRQYRENEKRYVDALEQLKRRERMAVIGPANAELKVTRQLTSKWIARGQGFEKAMYRLMVVVESEEMLTEEWKKKQRIGAVVRWREVGKSREANDAE
jgi:hypothetical protein